MSESPARARAISAMFALVLATLGCGPMSASATPPSSRESDECRVGRVAILDAMERSGERPCGSDDDCAVVTSPSHPSSEYDVVVHRDDGAELAARARAHLEVCSTFYHHEAIDAFRTVEARCAERCRAHVTTFHVEPL